MQLLDGKALSAILKSEIAEQTAQWVARGNRPPHLAAVLVGNDGASETYVASKVKSCEQVGFRSTLIRKSADITEQELLSVIHDLNANPEVDGYIVQLPLPVGIRESVVTEAILPEKDVDGFHPVNIGRMTLNQPAYLPATPMGILLLLERNNIATGGKHCVVLGRSNIVGMPVSILMARNAQPGNCTVTICHSRTKDLMEHTRKADILIAAIGKPEFVTGEMVKSGAVVIDVGISRIADPGSAKGYAIKGDVHFESVAPNCSFITPVPGGVGPMTVACLLLNTLKAAKKEVYQ